MTDNTITQTVTFADMIADVESDLEDIEDVYDDTVDYATEEYGDNRAEWPDEVQAQAVLFDQAAQTHQSRRHVLEMLQDEWESVTFEIALLTGKELMEIETELRVEAQRRDVQPDALQATRKQLAVDAATVDAPEEVPRDDGGSPVPSECPNPLTIQLHELVERLNQAGATDFSPPGFGETDALADTASRASPPSSKNLSKASESDDETTPNSGSN